LEKALLTREEWLRLAAQGSQLGLWYWNDVNHGLFWDVRTREIFGVNGEGNPDFSPAMLGEPVDFSDSSD